jgi:hypothetical protein
MSEESTVGSIVAPALPDGMIVVRNTDPHMAGQRFSRGGKQYRLDPHGRCVVPANCGIHLCGAEWVVEQGTPETQVVSVGGQQQVRPAAGPLKIWQCSSDLRGERVAARDGSIVLFNRHGFGLAAENCGLDQVPGFTLVADGTPEQIAAHGVTPPTSQQALDEAREEERLLARAGIETDEDEDDDPYAELQRQLARKAVVATRPEDLLQAQGAAPVTPAVTPVAPVTEPETQTETGNEAEAEPEAEDAPVESWEEGLGRLMAHPRSKLESAAKELGVEFPSSNTRYPLKEDLAKAILTQAGFTAPAEPEETETTGDPSGNPLEVTAPETVLEAPQAGQAAPDGPTEPEVPGDGDAARTAALEAARAAAAE